MAEGWLAGGGWWWLVLAGAGWEAGWPQGPPGAEDMGLGEGDALVWGGPEPPFIKKPINYSTVD